MKFKPLSPGLVEQCWGVRGWATWSSSHRSGSQPGRWEELFLFHHCRGVENWLADLEIQFVELEEEMSTTGPSIWWDSESSSPSWCCFPYSTQCHLQLAKSLGFLWVWTETSRDWKERLKLHREVHQQNQTCAQLPNLATVTEPDQWPWTQGRTPQQGESLIGEWTRKQNDNHGATSWAPWEFLNRSFGLRKIWVWILALSVSFLAKSFSGVISLDSHSDLGEAPHGTWRSQLGPELSACQSLNRDSFPWILLLPHFAIVDTEESFPRVMAQRKEKSLSERPFFQKMSMTIVVRGGTTPWWFSF